MSDNIFEGLGTTIAGIRMRSPIGIGSVGMPLVNHSKVTPEIHAEVLLKHVEAGSGYICLPATCYIPNKLLEDWKRETNPYPYSSELSGFRLMRAESKDLGLEGLYLASNPAISPDTWAKRFGSQGISRIMQIIKEKRFKDVPVIANVVGVIPDGWVTTARACEEAGVDLIELNFAGGHATNVEGAVDVFLELEKDKSGYAKASSGPILLSDLPDIIEDVVREVVGAVSIPVGIKLCPETGFPRIVGIVQRARDAGAAFVNCGNQAAAIVPPDIYNRGKPRWAFMDGNPFVGIIGNHLRMLVYKQIAAIAKYVPGIDIIATGGLSAPEHIVEAMMLGARTTQFVTPMLYEGRRLIKRDIQFLSKFNKDQNYRSVQDFIGLGLNYLLPSQKINFKPNKIYAEVDPMKCGGCGRCTDHICLAMHMENGTAKVNAEDCMGCGMCVALCREGAVSLKERA